MGLSLSWEVLAPKFSVFVNYISSSISLKEILGHEDLPPSAWFIVIVQVRELWGAQGTGKAETEVDT